MANAPNPPDPIDILFDDDPIMTVSLYTNTPDPANWQSPSNYVEPGDPNFAPQVTFLDETSSDADEGIAIFDQVFFDGSGFLANHTVKGYFMTANYDDCSLVLGYREFPDPLVLGPRESGIYVDPSAQTVDVETLVTINDT